MMLPLLGVLLAPALHWPESTLHRGKAAQRTAIARMQQQSSRDRLMDEIAALETAANAGANRRAILTGIAAGALGALAGNRFGEPARGPDALEKLPAEVQEGLKAAEMKVAQKEATLQALGERTSAAEAEIARAEEQLAQLQASRAEMEKELQQAEEREKQQLREAMEKRATAAKEQDPPPPSGPSPQERELIARVEAAEARAVEAEALLSETQQSEPFQLPVDLDPIFNLVSMPSYSSVDGNTVIGGALAVAALAEGGALIAANIQISNLKSESASAKLDADGRVARANTDYVAALKAAQVDAADAKAKLEIVKEHVDVMAEDVLSKERQLAMARPEKAGGREMQPFSTATLPLTAPSKEEEAKRLWLSRQNQATWGRRVPPSMSAASLGQQWSKATALKSRAGMPSATGTIGGSPPAGPAMGEEEEEAQRRSARRMWIQERESAKRRWLAQLDPASWGRGAAPFPPPVKGERIDSTPALPSSLSSSQRTTEEARIRWHTREDEPSESGVQPTSIANPTSTSPQPAPKMSEEEAKRAWLARHDQPTWGRGAPAIATTPSPNAPPIAAPTPSRMSEDEAKRAWLARLDQPTWGKAATAILDVAQDAADLATLTNACDKGEDEACDILSREEEAKRAWLARLDVLSWGKAAQAVSTIASEVGASSTMSAEEIAKQKWLARLDAPTWRQAATTMANVANEAADIAALTDDCNSGIDEACELLSREEEAKRRWLARLDVPTWGAAAAAVGAAATQAESAARVAGAAQTPPSSADVALPARVSEEEAKRAWLARLDQPTWGRGAPGAAATAPPRRMSEEEAKRAWLARLDQPTWGKAASAVSEVAQDAADMATLTAACDTGDDEACEILSREEEAKRAWLARLDVPSWGKAAQAVSTIASEVGASSTMSAEEIAKQKWLARLDAPTWRQAATTMANVANEAADIAALTDDCNSGIDEACELLSREEEAKRRWLARLDVPTWGAAAAAVGAAATQAESAARVAGAAQTPPSSADVALPARVSEEEAKRAWLARLDQPTWGRGAPGAAATAPPRRMSEEEAKRAWLARLDQPTWGKAASAVSEIAQDVARIETLTAACDTGDDEACEILSREEEAKRAWLARLDVPSWGKAAQAVSTIASEVGASSTMSAEEIAKQKWLARLDAPTWRQAATTMANVANEAADIAALTDDCNSGIDEACELLSREEEAKRRWLARLDVPTWGAAAAAVGAAATQAESAARVAGAAQTPPSSADVALPARMSEEEAKRAWLARLDQPTWGRGASGAAAAAPPRRMSEEEAKRAWLARLDQPTWGKAASAVSEVAQDAADMATLTAACDTGDDEACEILSREEEAKRAWLARLDVPSWGKAAQAVSTIASEVGASSTMSAEEIAKQKWLARLDAPTWRQAATTMANVANEAADIAALTDDCNSGIDEACELLSREEEAKRRWLARLDVPTWGAAAAAVGAAATQAESAARVAGAAQTPPSSADVALPARMSEEEAKRAWLARLDQPTWGRGASGAAASRAAPAAAAPPRRMSEEEAKRAWLARLDQPTWGKAASAVADVAQEASEIARLTDACGMGDNAACEILSNEEEAKRAWLARLDVPSWGSTVKAVTAIAGVAARSPAMSAEEIAKQKWLARLDAPTWRQAADTMAQVVKEAVEVAVLTIECDSGIEESCEMLSREEEAKRRWLSRLDVSTWSAAAAAVSAVATELELQGQPDAMRTPVDLPVGSALSKEEDAKRAWLARLDKSSWGRGTSGASTAVSAIASNVENERVLFNEEEAKRAWLARMEEPFGRKGEIPSSTSGTSVQQYAAASVMPAPKLSELEAKRQWLAKRNVPSRGGRISAVITDVGHSDAANGDDAARRAYASRLDRPEKINEAEAQRLWQALHGIPTGGSQATPGFAAPSLEVLRQQATKAWHTRLDSTMWFAASAAMSELAEEAWNTAVLEEACGDGDEEACDILASDDTGRLAWLARLGPESWESAATAAASIASGSKGFPPTTPQDITSEMWLIDQVSMTDDNLRRDLQQTFKEGARPTLLCRLDAKEWSSAAMAMAEAAKQAADIDVLTKMCDFGVSQSCTMLSLEDGAKFRLLAHLDAPMWCAVAAAISAIALEVLHSTTESSVQASLLSSSQRIAGHIRDSWQDPLPNTASPSNAEQPQRAASVDLVGGAHAAVESSSADGSSTESPQPTPLELAEEEAKRKWLASLDTTEYSRASVSSTSRAFESDDTANVNPEDASTTSMTEEEARKAWLARVDAPTWGKASKSVAPDKADVKDFGMRAPFVIESAASAASLTRSEEEAKQAWLARVDTPTWGKALRSDPPQKADVKDFDKKAPFVVESVASSTISEQEAKEAWLARVDAPKWGEPSAPDPPQEADVKHFSVEARFIDDSLASPRMSEEEAKKAWLARVDAPKWGKDSASRSRDANVKNEEEAKKAWLARVDASTLGKALRSDPPQKADVKELDMKASVTGSVESPTMREEEAKNAGLASVDVPTWGNAGGADAPPTMVDVDEMAPSIVESPTIKVVDEMMPSVAESAASPTMSEEEAKKAWLARVDAPTWAKTSASDSSTAEVKDSDEMAASVAESAESPTISEEEAKKGWLARVDASKWGKASASHPQPMADVKDIDVMASSVSQAAASPTVSQGPRKTRLAREGLQAPKEETGDASPSIASDAQPSEPTNPTAFPSDANIPLDGNDKPENADLERAKTPASEKISAAKLQDEAPTSNATSASSNADPYLAPSDTPPRKDEEQSERLLVLQLDEPISEGTRDTKSFQAEHFNKSPVPLATSSEPTPEEVDDRLDTTRWGKISAAVSEMAQKAVQIAAISKACKSGDEESCGVFTAEDHTKHAWLTRQDVPSWEAAAAAIATLASEPQDEPRRSLDADSIRRRLGGLDELAWARAALVMTTIAKEAADLAELTGLCNTDDDDACGLLSQEDETKHTWLASLDVASWNAASDAVFAVVRDIERIELAEKPAQVLDSIRAATPFAVPNTIEKPASFMKKAKKDFLKREYAVSRGGKAFGDATVAEVKSTMLNMEATEIDAGTLTMPETMLGNVLDEGLTTNGGGGKPLIKQESTSFMEDDDSHHDPPSGSPRLENRPGPSSDKPSHAASEREHALAVARMQEDFSYGSSLDERGRSKAAVELTEACESAICTWLQKFSDARHDVASDLNAAAHGQLSPPKWLVPLNMRAFGIAAICGQLTSSSIARLLARSSMPFCVLLVLFFAPSSHGFGLVRSAWS